MFFNFPHSKVLRPSILVALLFIIIASQASTVVEMDVGVDSVSNPPSTPLRSESYPTTNEWKHIENFTKTAAFLASLQASDGGIEEAEDNTYENTDNTLEAIWVWSRYYELTSDNQYYNNIWAAWNYSLANPAWLELDSGQIYSCAWALRAEMTFRNVYGNSSYSSYADQCADHIVSWNGWEPFFLGFDDIARTHIRGWAAGNLYDYAVDVGDDSLRVEALEYGNATKSAVEGDPLLLQSESWALSGGASMWGIVHSTMQEYPNGSWVATYGPYLRTEVTSPGAGAGNSQNGWEAWYALGHHASYEMTENMTYYENFLNITDRLLERDGDDDGGIPTNAGYPDDTDESWVTSYRAFFNLRMLLSPYAGVRPQPPTLISIEIIPPTLSNVRITWDLSPEDATLGGDVERYEIYVGTSYNETGEGYTHVADISAGTNLFEHVGAGSDSNSYFYYVLARDSEGFASSPTKQLCKFGLSLSAGPNLISFPVTPSDGSIESVFQTVSYEWVRSYDPTSDGNQWLLYSPAKMTNTLTAANSSAGYWVHLLNDANFSVAGELPELSSIPLKRGWNLVGYPSLTPREVGEAFAGIPWTRVQTFDPGSPPYHLRDLSPTEMLTPGMAIWIYVESDSLWSISL